MSSNDAIEPASDSPSPNVSVGGKPRWWRGIFALLAVAMLVYLFIVVPNAKRTAEADKHSLCSLQLRQIGMALDMYRQANGHYPPAAVVDKNGKPMHSWRVLILPYLGEESAQRVYEQYDFEQPWDGPANRPLATQMPEFFACPSAAGEPGITHYVAVVGARTLWPDPASPTPTRRFATDGPGQTIAVVETATGVNWLEPRDLRFEEAVSKLRSDATGSDRPHDVGVNALFADGHIEQIKRSTSPDLLQALLTASGGEDVGNHPYLQD